MRYWKLFSPDNDNLGGGDDDDPPITDPNPNPNPNPNPVADPALLSKTFSEGKKAGKKAGQEEILAACTAAGVEVVKDGNGRPDFQKTLVALKSSSVGATEIVKEVQADYEKKLAEERARNTMLENNLKETEMNHRLSYAVQAFDPVNIRGALVLFQEKYTVTMTSEGASITEKNGQLVYDAKTGAPITLEGAMAKFFKENAYLVKPKMREGTGMKDKAGFPGENPVALSEAFLAETDPKRKEELRRQIISQSLPKSA